uniref:CUB domain-containing protein n=1 Tax=Parastrongyloides trichosuri TaxID=131310 RepID=A0A0N5A5B6_PARTI
MSSTINILQMVDTQVHPTVPYVNALKDLEFKTTISGKKDCYYFINLPENYQVRLVNITLIMEIGYSCQSVMGAEIKFKADKTVVGPRFCDVSSYPEIQSEDNLVIIHYIGKAAARSLSFTYRMF